jgi:hypothetical protein
MLSRSNRWRRGLQVEKNQRFGIHWRNSKNLEATNVCKKVVTGKEFWKVKKPVEN